jgi:hypothetical protein
MTKKTLEGGWVMFQGISSTLQLVMVDHMSWNYGILESMQRSIE